MTVIDAIIDVIGVTADGYEWIIYAGAIVFFVLFMDWTFNLISVIIFHLLSGRKK